MHIIFVDHSIKRHTFFVRSKHLGLEYRKFLHEFHRVLWHHSSNDLCFILLGIMPKSTDLSVGSLHFLYGPQRGKVFLLGPQGAMFYNMANYHTLSSSSSLSESKDSYFSNNLSRYSSAISCIFVKYPTTSMMNSGGNL